jgi:hypothetical protein
LSAADISELDSGSSTIKIQGARYPEAMMKLSGR